MAPVTQYSITLSRITSQPKRFSTSPLQSLHVRTFSRIQAASPTGESVSPYASVWGFVPWIH